ncbi:MAG: imidazole glycerol phosphate synthase subunit HisF [Lysobacterales bacterium]
MLATRIIPSLLCRGRQLVKGIAFDSWRSVGVAAQAVQVHQARGVDELLLLDIAATAEHRGPDLALIEELSECCFMPLSVGGGIRNLEDVRELLRAGADKVVIGTMALQTDLVRKASAIVGSQAIIVSIDVKQNRVCGRRGTVPYDTSPNQPLRPEAWAREVEAAGAGEILLQSIDRDGTMQGYHLECIRAVSNAVDIPVIASGGAGTYQHLLEAALAGASAVAAGAMFQFTEQTPAGAARYLAANGVEVRLHA